MKKSSIVFAVVLSVAIIFTSSTAMAECREGFIEVTVITPSGRLKTRCVNQNADHGMETAGDNSGTSAAGWKTTRESDLDNDGNIDSVDVTTYDPEGRILERWVEGGWKQVYFYDTDGKLLRMERDNNGDGNPDLVDYYSWINGNLLEETDADNDGDADLIQYSTYDAERKLVQVEFDSNADSNWDLVIYFSYYSDGKLWIISADANYDGQIDSDSERIYDAYGDLDFIKVDDPIGDPIETIEDYTWDADGNLLAIEGYPGGVIDPTWGRYFTYDADGNLILEEYDQDGDGTMESVAYISYGPL